MQNKLQELTQKLYNEGLSKGQTEAEEILSKAKAEAQKIVDDAKTRADEIISDANKAAIEAKNNADAEIAMTSRQVITKVKQSVEEMITAKTVEPVINSSMDDIAFVQSLIKSAVKRFDVSGTESNDLVILLPEDKQKELNDFVSNAVTKQLQSGKLEFKFSKNINSGFRIESKNKGYYISFTEQDFDALFKVYMRPKMQDLLFSEK